MRAPRRHSPKAIFSLETLDERIVPSTLGAGAAVTHAVAAEHSRIHTQVVGAVHPNAHHNHHNRLRNIRAQLAAQAQSQLAAQNAAAAATAAQTPSVAPVADTATTQPQANVSVATPPPAPVATSASTSTSASDTASTGVSTSDRSSSTPVGNIEATPAVAPASTTPFDDSQNGPLVKAGQDLATIYDEFQKQADKTKFTSSLAGRISFQGTDVGIDAHLAGGDLGTFVAALDNLGMQVRTTDAEHGIVTGYLPIAQLPAAAQLPQTLSLSPLYVMHTL